MAVESVCNLDHREVKLVKNNEQWIFRFKHGEEANVLQQLARNARDPKLDFNWFDAAVLSHQIGDGIGEQIKEMIQS